MGKRAGDRRRACSRSALRAAPNMEQERLEAGGRGHRRGRRLATRASRRRQSAWERETPRGQWSLHAAVFDEHHLSPSLHLLPHHGRSQFHRVRGLWPSEGMHVKTALLENPSLLFPTRMYDTEVFWRALTPWRRRFSSRMVSVA